MHCTTARYVKFDWAQTR